jgi:chromosome segregation protein
MHLKKIKLVGFKSFVEPQILEFNHPVSCIVGPNGCGKSNIIDAVKWVIGESSAKYLRGEQMSDVIFNGSTGRPPVGQAQVELIFDNKNSVLKGQWADYEEVSIRRAIYRDGQSVYFLNNTRCRRRDILDLFLGTGLGQRSYAIIEQGMVSRFIDAKPAEIRTHIEEAAGISRYKERRKETLSKLNEAQDNLNRLADLKNELEKRVENLATQAQQAALYQEVRGLLVRTRQALLAGSYQAADRDRETLTQKLSQLKLTQQDQDQQLNQFRLKHAQDFKRSDQLEFQLRSLEQEHKNLALAKKDRGHQLEQSQMAHAFLNQQIREIHLRLEHIDDQIAQLVKERELLGDLPSEAGLLTLLEQQRHEQEQALTQLAQSLNQQQQAHRKLLTLNQEPKQQVEVLKTKTQMAEMQILQRQQAIASFQKELHQLEDQLVSLNPAHAKQQAADLLEKVEHKNLILEKIELELDQAQQQRSHLEQQLARLGEQVSRTQRELATLQQNITGRSSQRSSWFTQDNGSLYEVFQKNLPKAPYQKALSMALATEFLYHGDQAPSLAQLAAVADKDIEYSWGPKESWFAFDQPVATPAYWHQWEYCDSFEQALERQAHLGSHEVLLLPNGALLGANWMRPARQRPQVTLAQLLAQEKELAAQFELLTAQSHEQQQQLIDVKARLNTLQNDKRDHLDTLRIYTRDHQQASIKAERIYQQHIALEDKIQKIQEQSTHAKKHQVTLQEQLVDYRDHIEKLMVFITEQETSSSALERDLVELQQQYQQQQQALKTSQQDQNIALQKIQQWQLSVEKLKTMNESLLKQKELYEQEVLLKNKEQELMVRPIEEQKVLLQQLEKEFIAMQERLTEMTLLYQRYQEELRSLTLSERQQEQALAQTLQQLHQQEILWEKNVVELRLLVEQILDFGWEVEQIKLIESSSSLTVLKKQVHEYQAQLEAMGQVNLRALDEYEKEKERLVFIQEQYVDIYQATQELLEAVNQLDEEIKQTFDETFNKLNDSFQRLFPMLFGGGQASLVRLTAADNMEEGVVIKAQPPGKKNATLAVLSGGEKALTASALVFSFFHLNPAPFCLLDEIDAPLDDTNTLRLGTMIRKLSEEIQFIIVTHSKIMMEQGDILYGVTMKEPGVSRLVDVDIKAALEAIQ